MNRQPDITRTKRRVAWMFLVLWGVVLALTLYRVATAGDMKVTLAVSLVAVGVASRRLWSAYREK